MILGSLAYSLPVIDFTLVRRRAAAEAAVVANCEERVHPATLVFRINREVVMCSESVPLTASYPPLAIKLRSGMVLSDATARWHIDLLLGMGLPEEQWDEVVAESGFLDPQGTFIAGTGVRILEGSKYFVTQEEKVCH